MSTAFLPTTRAHFPAAAYYIRSSSIHSYTTYSVFFAFTSHFGAWGSRGRKFESSHPDVGSDCKITSFFVFYGQFISQHLHDSTLLALGAPFPASCVHVCHFEFHCQSAYLHCFHPDNSASVLLFLSVSRFSLAMYHFSRKTQQPVSIRNSLISTGCRLLCIKISK